ncbi:MAG TPA: metallophosphoesterase [Rhodocyclaceae bacterium]|nr:metallophosphoesterase [Rhodocyclaceae bacterium]
MSLERRELPSLPGGGAAPPADTVVYAVGDIHGRCDLLESIHEDIAADSRQRAARRKVLVYLGDYVSRGIDSQRVVELVLRAPPGGCEVVCLKGNHEDQLLRYLDGDLDAGRRWFDVDGLDTLAHYGVAAKVGRERGEETMESLRQRFARALPPEHLEFFRRLAVSHSEGGYRFVHAGIRPGVPLAEQSEHDQMWIRKPFLDSDLDHGAVVVHGHSVSAGPQLRHNRIGIDTGAYASGVLTCLVLDGETRCVLQTERDG